MGRLLWCEGDNMDNKDNQNNSPLDESSEFDFQPIPPEEVKARRLRLWKIGLILGGMVAAIVILLVAMISYSVGFNEADDKSSSSTASTQSASSSSDSDTIPEDAAKFQSQDVVGEGQIPDHYRGTDGAKVIAIEYADFNCSHCIQLASELNDLYSKYSDKVQFIYRNYNVGFTYSSVTPKIAEAAYVVGGEDAYWKVHDKLFNDSTWSNGQYMDDTTLQDLIRSYGDELGIDGQAMIDAYNNSANNGIDDKIARDQQLGKDSGVSGTPTWFINGESVNGTVDAISSKIDQLLGE